jgi:hypothetical protein
LCTQCFSRSFSFNKSDDTKRAYLHKLRSRQNSIRMSVTAASADEARRLRTVAQASADGSNHFANSAAKSRWALDRARRAAEVDREVRVAHRLPAGGTRFVPSGDSEQTGSAGSSSSDPSNSGGAVAAASVASHLGATLPAGLSWAQDVLGPLQQLIRVLDRVQEEIAPELRNLVAVPALLGRSNVQVTQNAAHLQALATGMIPQQQQQDLGAGAPAAGPSEQELGEVNQFLAAVADLLRTRPLPNVEAHTEECLRAEFARFGEEFAQYADGGGSAVPADLEFAAVQTRLEAMDRARVSALLAFDGASREGEEPALPVANMLAAAQPHLPRVAGNLESANDLRSTALNAALQANLDARRGGVR